MVIDFSLLAYMYVLYYENAARFKFHVKFNNQFHSDTFK